VKYLGAGISGLGTSYTLRRRGEKSVILEKDVGKLVEHGIIKQYDIQFIHIGLEKYANIIFTEPIYEARKIVRDYLSSVGVETIGRFVEWDYLCGD